ncbi:MAG: AAA family ATPase [Planctomycetes bacterium]|nr:AAA family ATPase [Planctomycetota bacterium]
MKPDKNGITHTLAVLFQPGDTIELRCVGHRPINGYYRDPTKLTEHACQLNGEDFHPPQNVYVCLNPVRPDLYARRDDQFGHAAKGEGVKDQDILLRRWLLIDIDPIRPQGVSATNNQKQAAIDLAGRVYPWLQEQLGSNCIVCADSGNGVHMLIRLDDVPADGQTRWVCENFLKLLDQQFSTSQAYVDKTTFNAARICTLYGTVKRKGSDIPEQPHRLSKLEHVPGQLQPVDWQRLAALVHPYPGDQATQQTATQPIAGSQSWNIEQLLQQHGWEYRRDVNYHTENGEVATRWELPVCPWNPEHNDNAAWIIQWPNGAVAAGCHHNGCTDKGWQALKQLWQLPASNGITTADIILPPPPSLELVIVRSQDVQPEPIGWLWPDHVVVGGINLFCGRGGIGKTFFLCDLVARITNQTLCAPNGDPLRHGRVLYTTGEDHIAKVLEPRMQQHAVDRTRLEYIKGLPAGVYVQLLDVVNHCDLLRDTLRQRPDTVALVLDPISSFQGGADSNKVSAVRQFTAVLTQLAEEFNIAVLGIHHFNKGKREVAGDSISGSHAYRDAARAAWLFALDAEDPTRRLMVCDKHNWSEQWPPGLAYRIESGRIQYEAEPLDMTADELLSQATPKPVEVACAWLAAQLSSGPQPAANLQIAATLDHVSKRTLDRAKERLKVKSEKEGDHWVWSLPMATEPPK